MSKRVLWSQDGTIAKSYQVNNVILATISQTDMDGMDSNPTYLGEGGGFGLNQDPYYIIFNFTQGCTIDKVQYLVTSLGSTSSLAFQISNNSTNGLDGDWTTVSTESSPSAGGSEVATHDIGTPTSGTWFRITGFNYLTAQTAVLRRVIMFGEYDSPQFEFWDASETAELTDNYQTLPDGPNNNTYSGFHAFKIKNTDSVAHSYELTIAPHKYGGDSVISNYFSLSDDDGVTKESTITITDLAAGNFSDELRLYADLTAAQNPADGHHYYYVRCEETA